MTNVTTSRRGIQSLEIGMRVLAVVARLSGPAGLSVIAKAAGLSSSQAHRYLSSLIATEMVSQEAKSGLYGLGRAALYLGLSALGKLDMLSDAEAAGEKVVALTGRTCLVTVWGDDGPTIIRIYPGTPRVVTNLSLGSTLPLSKSATGQIFYVYGGYREPQVHRDKATKERRSVSSWEKEIRSRKYAHISGDFIPGLRALAAPVFDAQGKLAFVLSLIAGRDFAASGDEPAAKVLIAACNAISYRPQ
jgi:DNA-binding IclR family transcriptional regulator